MTIDTEALRDAAFRVIDEGGLAWFDTEQLGGSLEAGYIAETDAQFIEAASPKNIVDLIDTLTAELEETGRALTLSGKTSVSLLCEASDLAAENADLQKRAAHWEDIADVATKEVERLDAENARLRDSLRWTAAALQACCSEGIREASTIDIHAERKSFAEILDAADAALERAALSGADDA